MKRAVLLVTLLVGLMSIGAAFAAPKSPPDANDNQPAHGCDQAAENDGDPYDSTCDGSPSMNGNGGGNANGKPCAGCVGAADNKNPPGQMPNGTDANNGYECDGNNGVGKTNPAHTGCDAYSGTGVQAKKVKGSKASFSDPSLPSDSGVTGGGLILLTAAGLVTVAARSLARRKNL
ncbi:MAG: hypothetical protein M3198_13745 [Actinomycetota bacterium]|nr:hypothetical protein [Actinomycetota bacterium]